MVTDRYTRAIKREANKSNNKESHIPIEGETRLLNTQYTYTCAPSDAGELAYDAWVAEWTDKTTTDRGHWANMKTKAKDKFNSISGGYIIYSRASLSCLSWYLYYDICVCPFRVITN